MRLVPLCLLLGAALAQAQQDPPAYDTLRHEARRQIVRASGTLGDARFPSAASVRALRSTLDAMRRLDSLQRAARPGLSEETERGLRAIDSSLALFAALEGLGVSTDSARSEFRRIAAAFEFAFSDAFVRDAAASRRPAAYLFSASVSCECTLTMCAEYLDALYALEKARPGSVAIAVIDGFTRTELNERYGVEFFPTLILLDGRRREMRRFVREEHLDGLLPLLTE